MASNLTCRWPPAIARGAVVLSLMTALDACRGLEPASSSSGAPPTAASSNPQARVGKVVITGAVNRTYTPENVGAVKIADKVGINVNEKEDDVCGVSIMFPKDLKPGAYQVGDLLHSLRRMVVIDVSAEYGTFCNEGGSLSETFQSTQGMLTLTTAGGAFSGSFQFTAAQIKDESKTIQVFGSFTNVPRP